MAEREGLSPLKLRKRCAVITVFVSQIGRPELVRDMSWRKNVPEGTPSGVLISFRRHNRKKEAIADFLFRCGERDFIPLCHLL